MDWFLLETRLFAPLHDAFIPSNHISHSPSHTHFFLSFFSTINCLSAFYKFHHFYTTHDWHYNNNKSCFVLLLTQWSVEFTLLIRLFWSFFCVLYSFTWWNEVPAPQHLTLERQLNKSVLIGWAMPDPPACQVVDSYHVYVDGVLKVTVKTSERTRALVEGVDLNRVIIFC